MNKKQLADMIAFIRWAMKNKQDEGYILLNVIHDLVGLYNKDIGFSPRTSGYAKKMDELEQTEKKGKENVR